MSDQIDFDAFDELLASDADGLLDAPEKPKPVTTDDRLSRSFQEIVEFFRVNGRIPSPETLDIAERRLGARLDGFLASPERAEKVKHLDEFGLLERQSMESLEDVLAHDDLGLLGEVSDIFDTSTLPAPSERRAVENVAKRTKAKNFEEFEPLFKQKHIDLAEGEFKLVPFRGQDTIRAGNFFVLGGVMLFVAEVGEPEEVVNGNRIRTKERLRVIFENGTESSLFRQSLASSLYDHNGRAAVRTGFDASEIGDADVESGHVYVLKSRSEDPQISSLENLYKIGFSRNAVSKRVANAAKEPTYLMAPVDIVADYRVYNLRPSALENILHRVFSSVRLDVSQTGLNGRSYNPSEWFVAPLPVINQAIEMIINGDIVNVVYDAEQQRLVPR